VLTAISASTTGTTVRLRDRLRMRPRLTGSLVALVFFWESLSPTLLPRAWAVQALLCGASSAIGYGLGATASVLLGWIRGARGRPAIDTTLARRAALIAWPVVILIGGFVWQPWQNDQRDLVAMPEVSRLEYVPTILVGAVLLVLFVTLGRLVGQAAVAAHRGLSGFLPRRIAFVVTVALTIAFVVVASRDFALDPLLEKANDAYGTIDDETEPGITPPITPLASGGPGSLVPWDTLGFQGRTFTGGITTEAQLAVLARPGSRLRPPIRVYAGLQSAPNARARAALVVRELERTEAFRRRVLVVATTTGTGWINPRSARAVEAINSGDTAIAGMQYSYFPSWISFLVDLDEAAAAGRTLFDAVYARWAEEPEATRPLLLVFGESLGSFGSEHAFDRESPDASVSRILSRADGALWIGPTWSNPIRTPLVKSRDRGSPTWRPEISDGRTVAFANTKAELRDISGHPVVYLQHPSDPVGWWNWEAAFTRPAWLQGRRGYDVTNQAHWFPIVTWGQTSADLIAGFSTPPGHGHNYDDAWVEAWVTIAAPPGWTRADTEATVRRVVAFPPQPGG